MRTAWVFLGVLAVGACSGTNTTSVGNVVGHTGEPTERRSDAGAPEPCTSAGGAVPSPSLDPTEYEPGDPDVDAVGDGRIEGGSFEGQLGEGWDYCDRCTHVTPGAALASDGSRFIALASEERGGCEPQTDSARVMIALREDLRVGEPQHLYFDIMSFAPEASDGALSLVNIPLPMRTPCGNVAPLVTLSLGDLGATSDWQTRCVTFIPSEPAQLLGVIAWGSDFHIGIDALRLGPPCRGED